MHNPTIFNTVHHLDIDGTFIYPTYETRFEIVGPTQRVTLFNETLIPHSTIGRQSWTIETVCGLNINVTATTLMIRADIGVWLGFPLSHCGTVLNAFRPGGARLISINCHHLLSFDDLPDFLPWKPAFCEYPWHMASPGTYEAGFDTVIVDEDNITIDETTVGKDIFAMYHKRGAMQRIGYSIGEIHEGLDKINKPLPVRKL